MYNDNVFIIYMYIKYNLVNIFKERLYFIFFFKKQDCDFFGMCIVNIYYENKMFKKINNECLYLLFVFI